MSGPRPDRTDSAHRHTVYRRVMLLNELLAKHTPIEQAMRHIDAAIPLPRSPGKEVGPKR